MNARQPGYRVAVAAAAVAAFLVLLPSISLCLLLFACADCVLCAQVDPYGVSKVLERDDNESSVLGALIR